MKLERVFLMMLIEKLSLEQVEYKPFNEVCEYIRGITYNKSQEAKEENEKNWKVLRANNIDLQRKVLDLRDVKEVDSSVKVKESQRLRKNDILICAGSGSKEHIGKVAFITEDMDYTFGGFMAVIRVISEKINSRFLFHILAGNLFSEFLAKKLNVSTINNLNSALIKNFQIPLPPLPIQQEIVRILDTFTNFTAELTDKLNAELTARRKQYEYYRDELLTFGENVPYMKLGEVVNISRGGSLQKKDFVENGVPCIHYGQIYTRYGLSAKTTFSFISEECARKQKMAKQNDIIMAVTSENLDDVCKCVAWLGNENVAVSGHSAIISHNQDSKYLAYFFESTMFFNQKKKLVHGTKVIEVTPDRLKNVMIPLPPLSIQKEIVCTLDMFTKFTTELTDKLNAELVARRKQCEYYRDKLLNFQEK